MPSAQPRVIPRPFYYALLPECKFDPVVKGVQTGIDSSTAANHPIPVEAVDLESGMRDCVSGGSSTFYFFLHVLTVPN